MFEEESVIDNLHLCHVSSYELREPFFQLFFQVWSFNSLCFALAFQKNLSSVYSRQKARAREILGVEKKANISVTRFDIKTIFG